MPVHGPWHSYGSYSRASLLCMAAGTGSGRNQEGSSKGGWTNFYVFNLIYNSNVKVGSVRANFYQGQGRRLYDTLLIIYKYHPINTEKGLEKHHFHTGDR